jgi:hypothetical protein
MGEIVNLKRARRDKERRERESTATANRRRFGRTKAQKRVEHDEAERSRRDVDGKQLEQDEL